MHDFNDLITKTTILTIDALNHQRDNLLKLNDNHTTSNVKFLQMIALQKAIFVTGMFAIFDAELQKKLNCNDGFKEVLKILKYNSKKELTLRFRYFKLAVNVIKHGKGANYDTLLADNDNLPFTLKQNEDDFFNEGDIDEISTLIKVDDDFLRNCADLINEISEIIKLKQKDLNS